MNKRYIQPQCVATSISAQHFFAASVIHQNYNDGQKTDTGGYSEEGDGEDMAKQYRHHYSIWEAWDEE